MVYQALNGQPGAFVEIYASVRGGDLPDELDSSLRYLPRSGYIDGMKDSAAKDRVLKILKEKGPEVRARIYMGESPGDNRAPRYDAIEMKPVDVHPNGWVRYGVKVSSRYLRGEHRVIIEAQKEVKGQRREAISPGKEKVSEGVTQQWYRLKPEGTIFVGPPNPAQEFLPASEREDVVIRRGIFPWGSLQIAHPREKVSFRSARFLASMPGDRVVPALVEALEQVRDNYAVVGADVWLDPKGKSPENVSLQVESWRAPLDDLENEEPLWLSFENGVRIGLLKDPLRTTFVLEADESQRARLAESADRLLSLLPFSYSVWGLVSADQKTRRLFLSPRQQSMPLADQNYWLVQLRPTQYELMTWDRLVSSGHQEGQDPTRPFLSQGQPVLGQAVDFNGLRGFLRIPDAQLYWRTPHLKALLNLSYRLVGFRQEDPGISAAVKSLQRTSSEDVKVLAGEVLAGERVLQAIKRVHQMAQNPDQPGQVDVFLDLMGEIQTRWGRPENDFFNQLRGLDRDQFNREAEFLIRYLSTTNPEKVRVLPMPARPRSDEMEKETPLFLGVALNPTLDIAVEVREEGEEKSLRVFYRPGGSPLNLIQAVHPLGPRVKLVTSFGGLPGDLAVASLRQQGITQEAIQDVTGPETRVSLMIGSRVRLVGEGEAVPSKVIGRMREKIYQTIQEAKRGGEDLPAILAVGERFIDSGAVDLLTEVIPYAKRQGCVVCLQGNGAWDFQTWQRLLETAPQIVVTPWDVLVKFLGTDQEIAQRVDALRRKYQVQQWLIPMRDGNLIVVTNHKSWWIPHSGVYQWTYASGTGDIVTASYLLAWLSGSQRGEAGQWGVTAGAVFRGREEEKRALLPSYDEIRSVQDLTELEEIPQTLPEGAGRAFRDDLGKTYQAYRRFHAASLKRLSDLQGAEELDIWAERWSPDSEFSHFTRVRNFEAAFQRLWEGLDQFMENRYTQTADSLHLAQAALEKQMELVIASTGKTLPAELIQSSLQLPERPTPARQGEAYFQWLRELILRLGLLERRLRAGDPLTLEELDSIWGPIRDLESKGHLGLPPVERVYIPKGAIHIIPAELSQALDPPEGVSEQVGLEEFQSERTRRVGA